MAASDLIDSNVAGVELAASRRAAFNLMGFIGMVAGPLVGLAFWLLPLEMDAKAQTALSIGLFMVLYWVAEPIDHGVTALIGCYLFWLFGIARFADAFRGFTNTTPWFLFAAFLIGEAASRTGLAKRFGLAILYRMGTSYPRLLLGVIILSFLLNFLIPNGTARVAVIAPIIIGLTATFRQEKQSNIAKGLFLVLCYTSVLFDKMIMSGASAFLTRRIIEEHTGAQLLWGQWFFAYLPAAVLTILAGWITTLWLYPAETEEVSRSRGYIFDRLQEMGAWSSNEKKACAWIMLALLLWSTDFIHGTNPAVIGIGTGLVLALPMFGVLDTSAIRKVNFLIVAFSAGALSMANVLIHTGALNEIAEHLLKYLQPILANPFYSAVALYWTGIVYHVLLANNQAMLSTSLPLLLQAAEGHGNNPISLGLLWAFAGGGNLFVYQSTVLVLGYSYEYFTGKDLLKLGLLITVFEGLLVMFLVPLYWPAIGLSWLK